MTNQRPFTPATVLGPISAVNTPIYVVEQLPHQTFSCDFEGCGIHKVTEFRLEHPNGHRNYAYSCGKLSHDIAAFNYARARAQTISLFRLGRMLFPNGPIERAEIQHHHTSGCFSSNLAITVHYRMLDGTRYCDPQGDAAELGLSFAFDNMRDAKPYINDGYFVCDECAVMIVYAMAQP